MENLKSFVETLYILISLLVTHPNYKMSFLRQKKKKKNGRCITQNALRVLGGLSVF